MAIVRTDDQYYHNIADAIREKTGGTEDILPENMAEELNNATLEELYVTPSSSEQTFTPESPCIGFSVVTVEAAPDTGGGDIVEPEELPNGETTTFGHIYTGETVTVTKYNDHELPEKPFTQNYSYVIYIDDTNTYCLAHVAQTWYYFRHVTNDNTVRTSNGSPTIYKLVNGVWSLYTTNGGRIPATYDFIFSNKDINTYNYADSTYTATGEIFITASTPTTEEVVAKVSNPVEREDEYRMTDDTLNEFCHLAQEASKSEELMTPAAALEILSGVVASLTT